MKQTSTLVNWIGYLAVTLLIVLPISVLTVRSGAWQQGLMMYALSCAGAALLLLICLLLLVLPTTSSAAGEDLAPSRPIRDVRPTARVRPAPDAGLPSAAKSAVAVPHR